ncbi:MAG: MogA/MoaB family molybdenum cofactor biosynthesis protein [Thermodesulfobacteriota bacterium]
MTQPALLLTNPEPLAVPAGATALAIPAWADAGFAGLALPAAAPLPRLRAGTYLGLKLDEPLLQAQGCVLVPAAGGGGLTVRAQAVRAGAEARLPARAGLHAWRTGLSLAVIVLSDKGAAGLREDKCAPLIREKAGQALDLSLAADFLIPDEPAQLRHLLAHLALDQGFDLILTSGGTGLGPRDTAPETTLSLIEKRLPGFERAMTSLSLAKTPHGAISRAAAGTIGLSLVVNLPGSPKAVAENLDAVLPAAAHAIAKLQGDPSDCAR